ncbi:unnamed protein product [Calypogeia fissa]
METYVVKVQNGGAIRRLNLAKGEGQFSYEQLQRRVRDLFQLPPSAQFGLTYVDKDGDVVTMAEDEDLKDALVLQALNPLRVAVENLNGDVKTSSPSLPKEGNSNEVKEQQTVERELPVESVATVESAPNSDEPVANAEPSNNSSENSALPEGKVSEIDGATDSKAANVASPASGTFVDGKKEVSPEGATENKNQEEAEGHPIHFGVKCDGCGIVPISGPRYKSRTKQNYDLCHKCYEASGAEENEYAQIEKLFYRVGYPAYVGSMCRRPEHRMGRRPDQRMCWKPAQRPNPTPDAAPKNASTEASAEAGTKTGAEDSSANLTPKVLHMGVQCDQCGMVPIEGARFKSNTQFNYDLCHGCFDKSGSNSSEYTRVDEPVLRSGPPLVMRLPVFRRGPPRGRMNPLSARWVWVLNRMVPIMAVDECETDDKTPAAAAGSEVKVGGEPVNPTQAESAAATEVVADATISSSKQEEVAVKAKGERNVVEIPVIDMDLKEADASTSFVPESEAPMDVQNVSTENNVTVNKLGETAGVEETVPAAAPVAEGDLSTQEGLLAKLAAMGFEDPKLNEELLEKNSFDLRKTLDDLCAAEEWDPILGELQEMGFYDANMNRRLMFKNNGSVKRVVKELVQMYKGEKMA